MKSLYIVSYDIGDPDRWRKVFKIMKGAGEHLQYSVFECDLSEREREQLAGELEDVISATADQVLFVDLGPSEGGAASRIRAIGQPYSPRVRKAVIV